MNNLESIGFNNNELQFRAEAVLNILRNELYKNKQPVTGFVYKPTDYKKGTIMPTIDESFIPFAENDQWGGKRDGHAWFYKKINFPKVDGRLEFGLRTSKSGWDAANSQFMLYIDGKIVQGMDVNHTTAVINVTGEHDVHLYAYTCPGKDVYFDLITELFVINEDLEKLYYNLYVPCEVLKFTEAKKEEHFAISLFLNKAISLLDMRDLNSKEFFDSIKVANKYLEEEFYHGYCNTNDPKKVACIGHTHIDIAWLWSVKQTIEKAQRSFATVTALMQQFPNYRFMSSQTFLYKAVKEENPELYERIKALVKEGRWDVEGSSWVEMDCNLVNGESLVRQFLFGKRFFQKELGVDTKSLWLPDVFGYSAALPQILKKCGINVFVTSKISWNDTNAMPYDTFWWKGIDGSTVLSHFITAQHIQGSEHYKFNRYVTYVANGSPGMVAGTYDRYSQKIVNNEALMTVGFGDGGGGTTPYDCECVERLSKGIPSMPVANFRKVGDYLQEVYQKAENSKYTPNWQGELYLEYHRGTYTSQAKNKRYNRKTEFLLANAETVSAMGNMLTGYPYKKSEINAHWETALVNQFHDIIPGSSIREVYDTTDMEYENTLQFGKDVITGALNAIAKHVKDAGVFVYNPNPFPFNGLVDYNGKKYVVNDIPAKGYKVCHFTEQASRVIANDYLLENDFLKVDFDKDFNIISVYDKKANRQVVKLGQKIKFTAYEDINSRYDAWELSKFYTEKSYDVDNVISHHIVKENGRTGIRIVRKFVNSIITETVYLSDVDGFLYFENDMDWNTKHIVLKKEFPIEMNTDKATCEIQYGSVERPTHHNTSWDWAKFEVCAHKYVDVSETDYGVAVINDCKYGHSLKDCNIGLTILKCATDPDPNADVGNHVVNFALYPHMGAVNTSDTANKAYIYNNPCYAVDAPGGGNLPNEYSFISCNRDNVFIDCVKQAEDDENLIVRLYEAKRIRTNATIDFGFDVKKVYLTDMLENIEKELDVVNNSVTLPVGTFEIITLKVML
ncbi:MAG: alpha-mannosidase [Clostridia bacterium]|nr:alpha-mannosidase [Clostridia bacterium]